MVDGVKVFGDVGFQHIDVAVLPLHFAQHLLGAVGAPVRSLAGAARKAVVDKPPLPDRLNGRHQRVLNHSVAER